MLINLAFIKATNGLFHYAMDYIAALEDVTSVVLVRSAALADAVRRHFPAVPTRVVGPFRAAAAVRAAGRRGEMVFTPSSHPIPGGGAQLVVVHDSYPFAGTKGAMKAVLFFAAMRASSATGGHINVADAGAFLLRGGLSPDRLRSAPNHMTPPAGEPLRVPLVVPERPVIGLFGTDSPKKDYHRFFAAVTAHASRANLAFRLFGQPNAYADGIISAFPELDIALTCSSQTGLEEFIRQIDIVASAATREGFNRPLALALKLGVPCWVVDAPVIREFYGNAVTFHRDAATLGHAVATLAPGTSVPRPDFTMPERLKHDFQDCITWLKHQDTRHP